MFYCNECAAKKKWPESWMKSYGRCEICDESKLCNSRASNLLPIEKGDEEDDTL